MRAWNGDGVDMTDVWIQTEDLQSRVKQLLEKRPAKPGEEQRWRCLDGLVTSEYTERSKAYFLMFTSRIMAFRRTPGLVYPVPVD